MPSITAAYSGFVNPESDSDLSAQPTCSTTYVVTSNVASTPATSCSGAASDDYLISYVDGIVTIGRAPVTVTASSPSVTYGDAVPTITPAYSGFVNSQTSSVLTTDPTCTTAYSTTSDAGTTPATSCSGAVAANYSFSYTDGVVTIGKATPALAWSNVSKTFGDSAYTITAPTVTGVTGASLPGSFGYVSSDTAVLSISASTVTVAGAGSATVTATFTPTDTTNYVSGETVTQTVTVSAAEQATLTITSTSGTYDSAISLVTSGGSGPGAVTYDPATDGTATGCSISGTSLTASTAGTCIVTARKAASTNYNAAVSAATTMTFAQAPQTITFANPAASGATYGESAIPVAPEASSDLPVTLTPTDPTVCTVSGGGVNLVSAGTCEITATQAGDGNYLAASDVTRSFTIAKANQATLMMTSPSSAIYGETITLAASGGSGTGALSFGIVAGTCTITPGTRTLVLGDAGSTCQVSATKQTDANYNQATSLTQTITIAKAAQTLAFTSTVPPSPLPNETYTPVISSVSAVTGSSTGLTPSVAASGACTESGGVVTFTATG
ncbi:MAG TPA: MBG domain-containing protein, partial [Acidimicrobiia bacterium]